MTVAEGTYQATLSFPDAEQYGLVAQMRRSAVSIPSNVAEGCGRETKADFARFLRTAYGSACELETQVRVAIGNDYGDVDQLDMLLTEIERARRMLSGLKRAVLARPS